MQSQEISTPRRRHHDRSFKADLILQSLVPGASVSAIALAAGINANLLFKWRRDHLRAMRTASAGSVTLVPVQLTPTAEMVSEPPSTNSHGGTVPKLTAEHDNVIEFELAGARLRVRGSVDEIALETVLRALRRSA